MELEWKIYNNKYLISNNGDVKRNDKYLNCSIMNRGYKYFQTSKKGIRKNYLIHHLVAELFIGARPEGLVIDHIDQNKLNNNVSNLRYTTQKINSFNHKKVKTHILQDDPERKYKYGKEYREENKEKLFKRIMCGCGKIYTYTHTSRHIKSERHINYIKQKNELKENETLCKCGFKYKNNCWYSHLRSVHHRTYLKQLETLYARTETK